MFEAYTPDGKLQFSASTSIFDYVAKGTMTVYDNYDTFTFEGGSSTAYVGTDGIRTGLPAYDFAVIRCSTIFVYASPSKMVISGDYQLQVTGSQISSTYSLGDPIPSTTVEYWLFRSITVQSTRSSGTGAQLFGPTGAIYWDSENVNLLRIGFQQVITDPASSTFPGPYSLPSGDWAFKLVGSAISDLYGYAGVKAVSGGFSLGWCPVAYGVYSPYQFGGTLLAVDVSRY